MSYLERNHTLCKFSFEKVEEHIGFGPISPSMTSVSLLSFRNAVWQLETQEPLTLGS